jgi:hypothetical protein
MLSVNYVEDDNNIFCVCDCGNRLITTKERLNDDSHCGCVHRRLLLLAVGKNDDYYPALEIQTQEYHEGRGINYEKSKWRARITYQKKEYHLGYYTEKDAAIEIRKEAEKNLNGDFLGWFEEFKRKLDEQRNS